MAEDLGTAVLSLKTDDGGLSKGLGQAEKKSNKVFGAMKTAAKVAAVGGVILLGAAVKDVVGDFLDGEKASAQTAAVLKSTGGAANVTKKHVENLATAIRDKTGIDDAQIQAGENMLLTFTKVRNGAGKNNKVFDDSTKILADLATATGKDMPTAAIGLGKALNDPVKGITALTRVGVTFDAQQKKTITQLVKTGHTAAAQKIILAELRKEFGGSAEAAGKTLGGQLQILKGQLEDAAGVIVAKVLPYVIQFVTWIRAKLVPAVAEWGSKLSNMLIPSIQRLWDLGQKVLGFLRTHEELVRTVAAAVAAGAAAFLVIAAAVKLWAAYQAILNVELTLNPIGLIVVAIAALAAGLYLAYTRSKEFRDIVDAAFKVLKERAQQALDWINKVGLPALRAAFTAAAPVVKAALVAIQTAIAACVTWIRTNWDQIKSIFGPIIKTAIDSAKVLLNGAIEQIKNIIKLALDIIHGNWSAIWGDLVALVRTPLNTAKALITTIVTGLGPLLLRLGTAAAGKLIDGLRTLLGKIPGWVADTKGAIKGGLSAAGDWLFQAGRDLINGLIKGIQSKVGDLLGAVGDLADKVKGKFSSVMSILSPSKVFYDFGTMTVEGLVQGIKSSSARAEQQASVLASNVIKAAQKPLQAAQGTLSADLSAAFNAKQGDNKTPAETTLENMQEQHDVIDRQNAIADAQQALYDAQQLGDAAAIKQAQKALDDAQYADKVATLQKTALAERTALNASQVVAQQAFDARLADLNAYLSSSQVTTAGATARINAMMADFGIQTSSIGSLMGKGFQKGIEDTTADVIKSVTTLAAAIKKALKKGLAIKSPSRWTAEEIGRPLVEGIGVGIKKERMTIGDALSAVIPRASTILQPAVSAPLKVDALPGAGAGSNSTVNLTQNFNETPASADPTAIGAVTSWSLRKAVV